MQNNFKNYNLAFFTSSIDPASGIVHFSDSIVNFNHPNLSFDSLLREEKLLIKLAVFGNNTQ